MTFHNGQQLTSADVVATLDAMYALSGFDDDLNSDLDTADRGLYYSTFYSIRSWEAVDELTVAFTLRRASYGSLYSLAFPILPASEVNSDMPAGTGPYMYDGYEQGSSIWLAANTSWWQRTPQVRYIRAVIYEDAEKALNAFDLQDVDVAHDALHQRLALLQLAQFLFPHGAHAPAGSAACQPRPGHVQKR